ncbi:MAG: Fic family protein [Bacteroidetes bacterium]|nr:MAG: Fic family protein [Bacteroidota bacterium]
MKNALYRINPDRTVAWNDLSFLPIDIEILRDFDILDALVASKSALGKLQGRCIAIPDPSVLVNSIVLQEAKSSTEIENIFTTEDELYKAFGEIQQETEVGSTKEVLHYREAIWEGFEHIKTIEKFDLTYFLKMFQTVKKTTDGFRPSQAKVYIKQGGTGPNAGKIVYTPPIGAELIENLLLNLLDFVNDDAIYKIDPLLKMAIAHYQFEAIHPFRDGNGRVGRIFNIHILTHKELLDFPVLYLSKYILETKDLYYSNLSGVSQRGDWKKWLLYMLKAIEISAKNAYQKLNEIVELKSNITDIIIKSNEFSRPESLVNMIFVQPYCKVKHFTNQKIYAENTARKYLERLCEKPYSMLQKKRISGNDYFVNIDFVRLLAE